MSKLNSNFYSKLIEVTSEVGMKPEDLLTVMFMESGLDPSAHNANGDASGLVQFMPETLKGLGFKGTHKDFRDLEAEKQLDYVKKLIVFMMKINGGPFTSAAQYYIGNFIPAALQIPGVRRNDPSTIICSKNPSEPHIPGLSKEKEMSFYKANAGLDADKDGNITYGDFQNRLKSASKNKDFSKALADLKASNDKISTMTDSSAKKDNDSTMLDSFLDKRKPSTTTTPAQTTSTEKPTFSSDQEDILLKYLNQLSASDKYNSKRYFKSIPVQNFTIKVHASKNEAIEFSRILSEVLSEELSCKAATLLNDNNVEISCQIPGPLKESYAAIKELSACVSDAFYDATKKIGSISVNTTIVNAISKLPIITLEAAQLNYRKFMLKFTR